MSSPAAADAATGRHDLRLREALPPDGAVERRHHPREFAPQILRADRGQDHAAIDLRDDEGVARAQSKAVPDLLGDDHLPVPADLRSGHGHGETTAEGLYKTL